MRFSIFVAVAVVVSLAIAPIGATAVAQESPTNATDEAEASNETAPIEDALADQEQVEIKERIDPTLAIVDWSYEDQRFTLTFAATESQEITVAEAIRAEEGTGRVTWDTYDIERGNSTIEVPVRTAPTFSRKGAAITIASDRSRDAGHASYVSSGMIEPDRSPVAYHAVQIMVLVSSIGGAGLAFRIVRNRRDDEEKTVERIA